MASGSPAYRYDYQRSRTLEQPNEHPVRVVPGRGRRPIETVPSHVIVLFKVAAVAIVIFAIMGFVRIGLTSATVETAMAAEELQSQVDAARAEGNALEVQESYLTTPGHVRSEAKRLGMAPTVEGESMTMPADVVTTDADGDLTLAEGLAQVAAQG